MAIKRMDNVAIVVEDLDEAIDFFVELGMTVGGRAHIEGEFADHTVGLSGIRSEIAMLATPDGHGQLELTTYLSPTPIPATPAAPPPNTIGLHRVMFNVDDIDDTVARLEARGATLLDRITNYEDVYRLCYLRGPSGIIVALAQDMS